MLFKMFRRKPRKIEEDLERRVTLIKKFEVLNCTPIPYQPDENDLKILNTAELTFEKIIQKKNVDEMCADMFDSYIDAIVQKMKEDAKQQYTEHMMTIYHNRGVLAGILVEAEGHLENLKQDLERLEKEIAERKEKNGL